ncbi:MAG: hypothetical protein C0624_14940 [Desulfuromonas sp.]|nr:MAG: hypothetical protein C0624_14940 [Desulfuromonas sp.]
MNRETFTHICLESEAGRDSYVTHPSSNEEGVVTNCSINNDHLVVRTNDGHSRCWDYHHCEELRPSLKSGPMG